jgi:hypothetical protein
MTSPPKWLALCFVVAMTKHLLAALTLLVLLLAPAARADVVEFYNFINWPGHGMDINGDGQVDFNLGMMPYNVQTDTFGYVIFPLSGSAITGPLTGSVPVDSTMTFSTTQSANTPFTGTYGVEFTDTSGQIHYGWINVVMFQNTTHSVSSVAGYFDTVPGEGIFSGTTNVVPEPSTYVLVGLGLVGLVGWRIRRA